MTTLTDNWPEIREVCRRALDEELADYIEGLRDKGEAKDQLIAMLHRVQEHFGYLGETQLAAVAQLAGIPHAKVTGVATFYHYFRLQPRGRFVINVCLGTACYVKGAEKVVQRLKEELGIGFGETSKDGIFTLEATRCVGTCGIAPVVMVNDAVHGPLTPDEVPLLLERYLVRARAEETAAAGS